MMKKLLLLLMICSLLINGTLFVYGEDNTVTPGSSTGSSTITVETKAVNQPEFTVSIPETIAPQGAIDRTPESQLHDIEFSVSISNLQYLNGKEIQVSIAAPDNQFCLYCGDAELSYTLYKKSGTGAQAQYTVLPNSGVFALFETDGEAVGVVRIDSRDITHAGQYTGSLIFTVEAVESTN